MLVSCLDFVFFFFFFFRRLLDPSVSGGEGYFTADLLSETSPLSEDSAVGSEETLSISF